MISNYRAVEESGSWSASDATVREERSDCGHKHRAIKAALVCLDTRYPRGSVTRISATIHDQNCRRVDGAELRNAAETIERARVQS